MQQDALIIRHRHSLLLALELLLGCFELPLVRAEELIKILLLVHNRHRPDVGIMGGPSPLADLLGKQPQLTEEGAEPSGVNHCGLQQNRNLSPVLQPYGFFSEAEIAYPCFRASFLWL